MAHISYHRLSLTANNPDMEELDIKGRKAREASYLLSQVSSRDKDNSLIAAAKILRMNVNAILEANARDVEQANHSGLKPSLIDRLLLTGDRINSMAAGLEQIARLEDPVGEVLSMTIRPNGLQIGQKRVPIGVVGMIYEARPNVTVDVFGLCIKTGNSCILRGGKEAFHSNFTLAALLRKALAESGLPEEALQIVEDTSRESAIAMMKLNRYLDVLIPRGGAGLIQTVVENSTVPVIETGVGNCHIYIDSWADPAKAVAITFNAKTQRPGVCNAAESLLVHKDIAGSILPHAGKKLLEKNVEIRGDNEVCRILNYAVPAKEEDWGTEYLDYIISVKIVDSLDEAIKHINHYGTRHSEAIITENYSNALEFQNRIDAAAVYVNASTRFTDGFEFGFGAEIGISTQKLHARGPMGLKALTSTKYIIFGNGQIRE